MASKEELERQRELPDERLLKLFESGSKDAFNILTLRYSPRLISYLYKYTGGSEDCKDISQEALIEFYNYRNKVSTIENFSAWIFRVTINKAKNHFTETMKIPMVSFEDHEENESYLSKYHKDEFTEEIIDFDEPETPIEIWQKCLDRLEGKFKSAILLRYDQDLDYETISKILKIPVGTVKSRINHGRIQLKEMIAEEIRKSKTKD